MKNNQSNKAKPIGSELIGQTEACLSSRISNSTMVDSTPRVIYLKKKKEKNNDNKMTYPFGPRGPMGPSLPGGPGMPISFKKKFE